MPRQPRKPWSAAEDRFLVRRWAFGSLALSLVLGRTETSVHGRLHKLLRGSRMWPATRKSLSARRWGSAEGSALAKGIAEHGYRIDLLAAMLRRHPNEITRRLLAAGHRRLPSALRSTTGVKDEANL